MKNKNFVRVISILIVFVTVLSFASCGGTNPPDESKDTTVANIPDTTEAPVTDPPVTELVPDLPEVKFDGATYIALQSGYPVNKFNDFSNENVNFAIVNNAIFNRNALIEEKYDVVLDYIENIGLSWGNGPGYQAMAEDYTAGDSSYDICSIGLMDAPKAALNGYAYDIWQMDHINTDMPWWDQSANKDLSISNRLFFTTGDISLIDNIATHALLFNKGLAGELEITDLYTLVETGKWTMDKFFQYARLGANDLNGDDVMDANDRYGLLCWNDMLQAFLAAAGNKFCTLDEQGLLTLTLYNDKSVDVVNKLTELAFDKSVAYNYVNRTVGERWEDAQTRIFSNDQALFYTTMYSYVPALRDTASDFGILPYPKYEETQENHYSYVGGTYSTFYLVESSLSDDELEFVGIITEELAYQSYKTVTPAYYEMTLKGTQARDEESLLSIEIVFNSRGFDPGLAYLIGDYTGQLTNMMKASRNAFTQVYEANLRTAERQMENINDTLAELKFDYE